MYAPLFMSQSLSFQCALFCIHYFLSFPSHLAFPPRPITGRRALYLPSSASASVGILGKFKYLSYSSVSVSLLCHQPPDLPYVSKIVDEWDRRGSFFYIVSPVLPIIPVANHFT